MKLMILLLIVALGATSARWVGRSVQPQETSFIGKATDELSTAILQGYIDDDKNIAFSPLGYSAILAILAEGASGATKNQLVSALHLPDNQKLTRTTYRYILERLKFRNEYKFNQPELKNYFYIYKNYTINDDYKNILEEYYLTDVKSVERYSENFASMEDEQDEKIVQNEENLKDAHEESSEKLITYAIEDTPDKVDISQGPYKPAKNIKEKIKLVKAEEDKKEQGSDDETMIADEARHHASSQILASKNDVTSSISVNSVGGKSSKATNPVMLIFNGIYFRGSWKKSFDVVEQGLFYKSNTEKKHVSMMKTRGSFKTASLPDLDSNAVLLPYDGGRYALLLVVPRTRDGLIRLIADLPSTSLPQIQESLQDEEIQLAIPSFSVDTTTKPVAALAKFGVSSIFGHEAELSGISSKEGLFVQELVQNVAVRVDEANTSASEIAATNVLEDLDALESLKSLPLHEMKEPRRFNIEHPFVFYILDCLDNIVIVSGKVMDPQTPED